MAKRLRTIHAPFKKAAKDGPGGKPESYLILARSPLAQFADEIIGSNPGERALALAPLGLILKDIYPALSLSAEGKARVRHKSTQAFIYDARSAKTLVSIETLLQYFWRYRSDAQFVFEQIEAFDLPPDSAPIGQLPTYKCLEFRRDAATTTIARQSLTKVAASTSVFDAPAPSKVSSSADPVLGWNIQHADHASISASDAIRYNSGLYAFHGREPELDLLARFCQTSDASTPLGAFQWLFLTGKSGAGKSRLALEFTSQLTPEWHAGLLTATALDQFDMLSWLPSRDTFIVMDDPSLIPDQVHQLLAAFQLNSHRFRHRVRALLLDREAGGSWVTTVFGGEGEVGVALRHHSFSARENVSDRLDLELRPLPMGAINELVRDRLRTNGLDLINDVEMSQLLSDMDSSSKDEAGGLAAPRPLFAAAVTEVLIPLMKSGDDVRHALRGIDGAGVVAKLIDRDRDQRWRPFVRKLGLGQTAELKTLELHENLIAAATICGGLDRDAIQNLPMLNALMPGVQPQDRIAMDDDLILQMVGPEETPSEIPPLKPDLVGELFVAQVLARLSRKSGAAALNFISSSFEAGQDSAALFFGRSHNSLYGIFDRLAAGGLADGSTDAAVGSLALTWSGLAAGLAERGDWDGVNELIGRIDRLRARYPENEAIAEHESYSLCLVLDEVLEPRNVATVGDYDSWPTVSWESVTQLLLRVDEIAVSWPHNPTIALHLARFLATTLVLSAPKEIAESRLRLARLALLQNEHPDFIRIAIYQSFAVMKFVEHAVANKAYLEANEMLIALERLSDKFQDSTVISQNELKSVSEIISKGPLLSFDIIINVFTRIYNICSRSIEDHNIKNEASEALCCLFLRMAKDRAWDKFEHALEKVWIGGFGGPLLPIIIIVGAGRAVKQILLANQPGEIASLLGAINAVQIGLETLKATHLFPLEILEADVAATMAVHALAQNDIVTARNLLLTFDRLRKRWPAERLIGMSDARTTGAIAVVLRGGGDNRGFDELLARLEILRGAYSPELDIGDMMTVLHSERPTVTIQY